MGGGLPPKLHTHGHGPKETPGVHNLAATRLMRVGGDKRGEGPSAGTQTPEPPGGRPHRAQDRGSPPPARSPPPGSSHSRRAPEPAPGIASFQLGQITGDYRN